VAIFCLQVSIQFLHALFLGTNKHKDHSRSTSQFSRRITIMKKAKFTKSVTVMLDPVVHEEIKQVTDEREISVGEWIREAVRQALEREGGQTDDK